MSLKPLIRSPKSVPLALALLVVGLLMLTCAIEWHRVFTPLLHLSPDLDDFAHGLSIGLALSLEISALLLLVTHLQTRDKKL